MKPKKIMAPKNIKYFLIPLLLGMPVWWGANILQERLEIFFYWMEMAGNPHLLAAQEQQLSFQNHVRELKPLRDNRVQDLEISAKSAVSLLVDNQGEERMLFEKEKDKEFPIASLTKLMTAKIVLDNYDLSKEIVVSKEAVGQEENFGKLTVDSALSVKYLLYPLLMESSNDAAYALANDYDGMTEKDFIKLMNEVSKKLEMANTHFFNSSGLEPDLPNPEINYSTVSDLSKLVKNLLKEPLVWEILSTPKFNAYGPELANTNELLGKIPRILGGKTGYAEKAQGCFILVLEAPKGKGYIINVILGSNNKFGEMEKLANWINTAYVW